MISTIDSPARRIDDTSGIDLGDPDAIARAGVVLPETVPPTDPQGRRMGEGRDEVAELLRKFFNKR